MNKSLRIIDETLLPLIRQIWILICSIDARTKQLVWHEKSQSP
jgi:hypothetical protein